MAKEHAMTLVGTAFPIVGFPEYEREKVLEVLGFPLPPPPSIPLDDSRFRLLLNQQVTVVLQPGEDSMAVKTALLPYAEELGERIVVTNAFGGCVPTCSEQEGVLRIHVHAAPAAPPAAQPQTIQTTQIPIAFGLALPAGVSEALTPSGIGQPILTPEERVVVAEALPGNLYILLDVTHCTAPADLIHTLLSRIMELFLQLHHPAVQEADPKQAYIKACLGRLRMRRAYLEWKSAELGTEMARLSQLLVERAKDREHVLDELDGLKRRGASVAGRFAAEYEELRTLPHVQGVDVRGRYLHLYLSPIHICHAGESYPLGPYEVRIPLDGSQIAIRSDTPRWGRDERLYMHPHVWGLDQDQTICWGNIASDVAKLLAAREYGVLARLLIEFLHQINKNEARAVEVLRLWRPLERPGPCTCEAKTRRRRAHQ